MTGTREDLVTRIAAAQERVDAYHPDCSRRYVMDELREARARVAGHDGFLAGEYDRTYSSVSGLTLDEWRAKYAADALRTALHHVLWAEVHAGLRDRDEAFEIDPWHPRNRTTEV